LYEKPPNTSHLVHVSRNITYITSIHKKINTLNPNQPNANPIPIRLNIILGTNPPTPIPNNKTKLHKSFANVRYVGSTKVKKYIYSIHKSMTKVF